jgi:hypothetical protein
LQLHLELPLRHMEHEPRGCTASAPGLQPPYGGGGSEEPVKQAVKAAEVRRSALPRSRLVFLALGLEGALGGSGGLAVCVFG